MSLKVYIDGQTISPQFTKEILKKLKNIIIIMFYLIYIYTPTIF